MASPNTRHCRPEQPGLFGMLIARAEAQVLRLSPGLRADRRRLQIHPEHLRAALAVWRYCEASAKYMFGDAVGNPPPMRS